MATDDTLLVQSGKPVGVVRTHEGAPRVLIANSLLVPKWATPEHFRELEDRGLMMYGQMTAGSWIYIGTQGILQGTYATFTEVANQHFGGTLAGTITLTGGLGGMGGAQPLAVTGNGGAALCIEVDPCARAAPARPRLPRRDRRLARRRHRPGRGARSASAAALSVAVVANCADVLPELVRRGWVPDMVTDQTSAHDALNGYVPNGMTLEEALELRTAKPSEYVERVAAVDGGALPGDGRPAGGRRGRLRLRQRAARPGAGHGLRRRVRLPGLRAGLHPAAVRARRRAVPLGLPVRRRRRTWPRPTRLCSKAFPDDDPLQRWVRFAAEKVQGPGAAVADLLARVRRARTWPGRRSTTWSRPAR